MLCDGDRWQLFRGDELLATLAVTGRDMPWLYAALEPEPAFTTVRPLFDAENAASEAEDWDKADELYEEIRAQVHLTYPDGRDVPEFLLHIEGDIAWWRWNDEAFSD